MLTLGCLAQTLFPAVALSRAGGSRSFNAPKRPFTHALYYEIDQLRSLTTWIMTRPTLDPISSRMDFFGE